MIFFFEIGVFVEPSDIKKIYILKSKYWFAYMNFILYHFGIFVQFIAQEIYFAIYWGFIYI